jgi:hypothetical protein
MKSVKLVSGTTFAALVSLGAHAELLDPPYWALWEGGSGKTVDVCGGATCSDVEKGTFTALTDNYGKGSGHINPFLRFHHNEGRDANGSQTWEAAYNTNYRNDGGADQRADGSDNPGSVGLTGDIKHHADQFDLKGGLAPTLRDNQAKDGNAGGQVPRGTFNHAIRLSDLLQGDGSVRFLLDINEPGGTKSTLLLDELAIFIADTDQMNYLIQDEPNPDGIATTRLQKLNEKGAFESEALKVWDMDYDAQFDANGDLIGGIGGLMLDNINDSGPAGSGDYDMMLELKEQLFLEKFEELKGQSGLTTDNTWVYLYNFAGSADTKLNADRDCGDVQCTYVEDENGNAVYLDPNGGAISEAEAGFEEWAFMVQDGNGGGEVTEPGSLVLSGIALAGVAGLRRRRKERRR